MDTTLDVTPRSETGKGWARRTRAQGLVPAVVYGPKTGAQPVTVNPATLLNLFKETMDRNTVVNVQMGGDSIPCVVRELQRHPLTREVLHVDFYAVPRDRAIEAVIPLTTVGKPAGAVLGGRVRLIRRDIKIRAIYSLIPKVFAHDVSPMEIGDRVLASQLELPEGVTLASDHDFNVIELYGKRQPKKGPE
jgi:large subunit ribosomal protein L25